MAQLAHHSRGRGGGRGHSPRPSRNKQWVSDDSVGRGRGADSDRWERGGGPRQPARGRGGARNMSLVNARTHSTPTTSQSTPASSQAPSSDNVDEDDEEDLSPLYVRARDEPDLSPPERLAMTRELARLREVERRVAIKNKQLDDFKPKRLEDAITVVGTCRDMCSRAERYRRENEMLLVTDIENVPGDKRRLDHNRAVTRYERGVGDKVVPSDLRPGPVLVMTLNYLFHQLLPEIGFQASAGYISDRTRAVRSDMTIQHMTNITSMEINHRIARHHILVMHLMRGTNYNVALEEQRLMNTLQTLKETYEDYRQPEKDPNYTSPHEIEMRVYQRLSHIRDQVVRKDYIAPAIASHPVFIAVNDFRQHVQKLSAPISKTSKLLVDKENKKSQKVETIGRDKFMHLVQLLQQLPNGQIVVYLVVCLMEYLFKESELEHLGITNIEALRGELDWPDLIEGLIGGLPAPVSSRLEPAETQYVSSEDMEEQGQYDEEEGGEGDYEEEQVEEPQPAPTQPAPQQSIFGSTSAPSFFGSSGVSNASSPFGQTSTAGTPAFGQTSAPAFGQTSTSTSTFSQPSTSGSVFGRQPTSGFFGSQPASTTTAQTNGTNGTVFGKTSTSTPSAFGQTSSTSGFGQSNLTPAFGQTGSTPAFGQTGSTSAFGQTSSSNPFNLKVTPNAFNIPAFGQPVNSTPAPSASPFGAPKTQDSAPTEASSKSLAERIFGSAQPPAAGATQNGGGEQEYAEDRGDYGEGGEYEEGGEYQEGEGYEGGEGDGEQAQEQPQEMSAAAPSAPFGGFFGQQPKAPSVNIFGSTSAPNGFGAAQSRNPFQSSSTAEKEEPKTSIFGGGSSSSGFGSSSSNGFGFGIKPGPSSLNPDAKPFAFPARAAAPVSAFPPASSTLPTSASAPPATTEPSKPKSIFSQPLFSTPPAPSTSETTSPTPPAQPIQPTQPSTSFTSVSLFGQLQARPSTSQPAPSSGSIFCSTPAAGSSKEAPASVLGAPKPPASDANPFKARNPSPLKVEIIPSEDAREPEVEETRPTTATEPPPLGKVHTISLPSTPTSAASPFGIPGPSTPTGAGPGTPGPNRLLSRTQTMEAPKTPSGALSPLQMNSPTGFGSFPFPPTPSAKAKGKQPEQPPPAASVPQENSEPERDPKELVRSFLARSHLVKMTFKKWEKKAVASGEYKEAVRKAEEYHEKVRRQSGARRSMGSSTSSEPGNKRAFQELSPEEIKRKRAKRRSTGYKPPVTDEEMTARFIAHRDEHKRTWAPGTFLQALRTLQGDRDVPPEFRVWISLNQVHDGTAIWLERKFNIPDAGKWETEIVFSVPLAGEAGPDADGFPGLILFECTPLEGVEDELERKYRVLDDCARLREILKGMPDGRHFLPSVLFVQWTSKADSSLPSDLAEMMTKAKADETIGSLAVLPVSAASGDMDAKFYDVASKIDFDLEGKYVRRWSFNDVFETLEPRINDFFEERLDRCMVYGRFDWVVFGQLLKSVVEMLNDAMRISLGLLGMQNVEPLPAFDKEITNEDSAYELALDWLAEVHPADLADQIGADIISQRDMEREFPAENFLDNILDVARRFAEEQLGDADAQHHVMVEDHREAMDKFRDATIEQVATLEHALTLRTRRSPAKRREASEATEISTMPKRRRMSSGLASSVMDGTNAITPSTSMSSTSPETPSSSSPQVTAAMLRELTKNVKQKFLTR